VENEFADVTNSTPFESLGKEEKVTSKETHERIRKHCNLFSL